MNNAEQSAEFRKQMSQWLKDETGQPTELPSESSSEQKAEEPLVFSDMEGNIFEQTSDATYRLILDEHGDVVERIKIEAPEEIDLEVDEAGEVSLPEEKPQEPEKEAAVPETDVVGVQRMLENMSTNELLLGAELKVGLERYKAGDTLTPKQQGQMELARRMFKEGIVTPDQASAWLDKNFGSQIERTETAEPGELAEKISAYRQLEAGSPEETAANQEILTKLLQQADIPNPEAHAIELRAALRKQTELTANDQLVLENLRNVVEQKVRSLRKGENAENSDIELAEIGADLTAAYEKAKQLADGPEKRQAMEKLLTEILPTDTNQELFLGLLETFMKGTTAPEDALKAVQNQYRKRTKR